MMPKTRAPSVVDYAQARHAIIMYSIYTHDLIWFLSDSFRTNYMFFTYNNIRITSSLHGNFCPCN